MKIIKLIVGFLMCAVAGMVIQTQYELPVCYITATADEVEDFSEETMDMLTYHKYADHIKIASCDHNAEGEINIPETIEELPVTVIGAYAFNECNFVKSIFIPESIESIEACAFYKCENLENITIENPDCNIENSSDTICNNSDENDEQFYFNGNICGHQNSTVQAYAENYGYNFVDIEPLVVVEPTSSPTPTETIKEDETEPETEPESESTETTTTAETTTSEEETTATISQTATVSTEISTVKKTTNTANTSTTTSTTATKTTGWAKPPYSPQTDQKVPPGLKIAWGVLTIALIGLVFYTIKKSITSRYKEFGE